MTVLQIRSMPSATEVQLALDWAAWGGWNPGLHDAAALYATDPTRFLVAEVNQEPIGCIAAVRYDSTFGCIGLYIIKPEWRGQGHGLRLWQTVWEQITDRLDSTQACIGLDGVVERAATYQKAGFVAAYRHVRHLYRSERSLSLSSRVVRLSQASLEMINSYDREIFPVPRSQFLATWLSNGISYGMIESSQLVRYGTIRPCRDGFKVGPLFANDLEIADALFRALTAHADSQPVFIDVPDINRMAQTLSQRYELQPVFVCVRMYWGCPAMLDVDRCFGVTTLELG